MSSPNQQELARLLKAGNTPLPPERLQKLWRFHEMLRAADAKLNLTRIRAFDAMVEKHYIDSLLPGDLVQLESPLMDLGSGGGFPGIPLAIRFPDLKFKLVEGRRLRAGFLMNVASALGLKNVEVIARKLNPSDQIAVQSVITRAFSAIDDTLERVAGSVAGGGSAVLLKGPNCDDEIAVAAKKFPEWRLERDIAYSLPFSGDARRILVFRRDSDPVKPRAYAEINSADNPRLKAWRKLQTAKGIKAENRALLTGERYIRELAGAKSEAVETFIACDPSQLAQAPSACECVLIGKELMRNLDVVSGQGPLAVVKTSEPLPWSGKLNAPLTLLLATQLPENVGAILRTAEALGVGDVVLLREAANPFLPKALRAAGPAPFRLRLYSGPSLAELDARTAHLVALDVRGVPLPDFRCNPERPLGLIVGMEGPGTAALQGEIQRLTIPLQAGVDSLNAAVAAGIAIYAIRRQKS